MKPNGIEIKDPCIDCRYRDAPVEHIAALVLWAEAMEETVLPGCRHPWRHAYRAGMSTEAIVQTVRSRGKNPKTYGLTE